MAVEVREIPIERKDGQRGFRYHYHRVYRIPIGATLADANLEQGDSLPTDFDNASRPTVEIEDSNYVDREIKGLGAGERAVYADGSASMYDTVVGSA